MIQLLRVKIFALIIVINHASFVNAFSNQADSLSFVKVIVVPNMTKDQLYVKANTWMVEVFNSPEAVIEFQDKEAGKIAGKFKINHSKGFNYYYVWQVLTIDVKDLKLRLSIHNPLKTQSNAYGEEFSKPKQPKKNSEIEYIQEHWEAMFLSLKNYILQEEEDW